MRFPRLGSLRLRLTIAFLLVSIPSMLAAALIAAQLLSSAFDSNLQQWLEEASHYFLGDIAENEAENARIAALVGRNINRLGRLPQNLDDLGGMEFYQATGKDFVAIISSNGAVLFGPEVQGFPASAKKADDGSLVMMRKDGQSLLAIGGQYQMPWQGQVITIIVGSSLYDTINNAGKSMKALHFSLWQMEQGVLVNANRAEAGGSQNAQTALVQLKPPAAIVAELNRGAAPIIDDPGDEGPYYYTAYSPLKSASGDLIGVLSITACRVWAKFSRMMMALAPESLSWCSSSRAV